MAAATAVADPFSVVFFVGYGAAFGYLSFDSGNRVVSLFNRRAV